MSDCFEQNTYQRQNNCMETKHKTERQTDLSKTLLSCPYRSVNNLQEKLSSSWVEDENRSVDWFGGQVTFKGLKQG